MDGPRRPKRKAGNFKRVKVVAMVAPEPQRMVVYGPCGTRVEGLTVREVAELFEGLSCSA